ncbi:MAG TPA: sialidase family protein [Polyangiaceae bacterium]|nr:sialidase family protein [Polyangiaceae bacterium]
MTRSKSLKLNMFFFLGSAALGCKAVETPSQPLVGCQPARPALAHYPNAQALSTQPANAPYPCAVEPGVDTHDFAIVATEEGTLIAAPAPEENFVRSRNNGQTWEGPTRMGEDDGIPAIVHPWLWQDDKTGRIFFNGFNIGAGAPGCQNASGTAMWFSDDEGDSWQYQSIGCDSKDFGKIITGPPVTEASKAALARNGYPNMVYFCAEGPTLIIGPNRMCYRSLDGGRTFARTKSDAVDAARGQGGWPQAGAVGADGTLYVTHGSDSGLQISTSRDEGDSWLDVPIPNSAIKQFNLPFSLGMTVATDSAGNAYVAYVDERDLLPYVSFTRDRGASWSQPIMVGAPDVKVAQYPSIVARSPGYIMVAYYGSPKAEGTGNGYIQSDERPYHGKVVVTRNVFAAKPVLWSTTINDPATPLFTGMAVSVTEYLGRPSFGPDGSAWATFQKGTRGLVGRFVPPPPNP